jgi:hypothetical protein
LNNVIAAIAERADCISNVLKHVPLSIYRHDELSIHHNVMKSERILLSR